LQTPHAFITSIIVLCILAVSGTMLGTIPAQAASSGSVFYFHYKSQLYRNDNASITLLELANLTAPARTSPQVVEVDSSIRNVTTIFGSVWVGTIGWTTPPLAESTAIHGSVNIQVWLSSGNNATPTFSGIGAGIAVVDPQNRTVGNYTYAYRYAHGSILTANAKQYAFSVNLDKEVAAGQRLIFAVGIGSTTPGWPMKVYFDAAQYPSQAQLPTNVLVLPEFTQTPIILTTLAALTAFSIGLVHRFRYGKKRILHPGRP